MSTAHDITPESLTDFLLRLVGAPSVSTQEEKAARVLREELQRCGFAVDVDEIGNVIATMRFGPGPTVLFDAHLDTVGVTDPTAWSRNPAGELADGRIYGRGTVDMKGPMAACAHGLASLRGNHHVGTVVMSGTLAEELAEGPNLVRVAERVRPDYVVICEATYRRIAIGQRGRAEVVVEVSGRSSHSAFPEVGLNAAEVMADIVVALREAPRPRHPVLGEGILVLTDVVSRPYPGLSVIPDLCRATFDRRTLPGETEDDVLRPIRTIVEGVAARHGTRADVSIAVDQYTTYTGASQYLPNFAPSWFTGPDAPIVRAAMDSLLAAGHQVSLGHYSFCTNGSGTAGTLGIPTIGYGPAEEHLAHTVDESIDVDDLYQGALGYAQIARGLTSLPVGT